MQLSWELTRVLDRGNRRVVYPEIPFLFCLLWELGGNIAIARCQAREAERKKRRASVRTYVRSDINAAKATA